MTTAQPPADPSPSSPDRDLGDGSPPHRVDVVLRVYNGAAHVEEAVRSVLEQTLQDFELIVVDDGSTDDTPSVLAAIDDPRLRIARHAGNQGRTAALRTGIAAVRAPLLAFIDADDMAHPSWLEEMTGHLAAHPSTDIACPAWEAMSVDGAPVGDVHEPPRSHEEIAVALLVAPPIQFGGTVGRTAAFTAEVIDFPHDVAEDYYLWSILLATGHRFVGIPTMLYRYRRHPLQSMQAERDDFPAAHRAVQSHLVEELWPDVSSTQRIELVDWLHWCHRGRHPAAVTSRAIMDRSPRASRVVLEHPPRLLDRGQLVALRRGVIERELVAWGGRAGMRELLRARHELGPRRLLRCVVRSLTGR